MGIIEYLRSLLQSLLASLGLTNKTGTVLLLGLDNAGKTTLLHRLRTGGLVTFPPTERPNLEEFQAEGIHFKAWDLGGHEAVRCLWEDYVTSADVVVFLIDSIDIARLDEVRDELDALVSEGVLDGVPLAIMANKVDVETSASDEILTESVGYKEIQERHGRNLVGWFRISVLRGTGYQDGFRWIATFL